nr:MAG TPA: hypothetical protein [Caudoviricetes sp.]
MYLGAIDFFDTPKLLYLAVLFFIKSIGSL